MKVAGYARVSTKEQSLRGISLDEQIAAIETYCSYRRYELTHIYVDRGISGNTPFRNRPDAKKLFRWISRHHDISINAIIATKLDRLFRNTADALTQIKEWKEAGIALHLINFGGGEMNTDSAIGQMLVTVLAAVAEMERNLIAERVKAAIQHLKRNRRVYNGIVPFGFKRGGDDNKDILPNYDTLKWVKIMFDLWRDNWSTVRIAKLLASEGVPTKRGGLWRPKTVEYILRNPIYVDEKVIPCNIDSVRHANSKLDSKYRSRPKTGEYVRPPKTRKDN